MEYSDHSKQNLLNGNVSFHAPVPAQPLYKKFFAAVAFIGSFATLIVTVQYANNNNLKENYLGGLNFQELIFNFHPIFMVSGMIVCFVNALLTFIYLPFDHYTKKIVHGLLHFTALACIVLGLFCVIVGNNYTSHNTAGGYYFANFFSLHSFFGLGTIAVYFQNFVLGFLFFIAPVFAIEVRRVYKPNHVLLGVVALLLALVTVATGAMELFAEAVPACAYSVSSPDLNPAQNYGKLTGGCLSLNAIAILAGVTVVSAIIAVIEVKTRS